LSEYGFGKLKLGDMLFRWKAAEQAKHVREPGVVYVTDLVECPLKRHFEEVYPEVAGADFFNPATLVGDIVHKGVASILSGFLDAKFEVEGEMVFDGVRIRGRADMLLEDRVVDFKFVKGSYNIPHPHHILQVRVYLRMFGKPNGSLLYIAPDRITEIDETVEPNLAKPISDEELREMLQQRNTPLWSEWECSYCPWVNACPKVVVRGRAERT